MYSTSALNPTSVSRTLTGCVVVAGFKRVCGEAVDCIAAESLLIMVTESAVEAHRECLRR